MNLNCSELFLKKSQLLPKTQPEWNMQQICDWIINGEIKQGQEKKNLVQPFSIFELLRGTNTYNLAQIYFQSRGLQGAKKRSNC